MENSRPLLSLGCWPLAPQPLRNPPMTPITRRILAQVHLVPAQLLPLTYQDYLKGCEQGGRGSEDRWENYQVELERRRKQAAILVGIRSKYILGQDYDGRGKDRGKPNSRSKENTKRSINRSDYGQPHSQLQSSKLLSKVKSQKRVKVCSFKSPHARKHTLNEDSDYFVHFNPRKSPQRPSPLKEDESTKSKHLSRKLSTVRSQEEINHEYGFAYNRNTKPRNRKESLSRHSRVSRNSRARDESLGMGLCHELLVTMEKWEELDREHLKELSRMGNLTAHQRERLAKMQAIEKSEMHNRISRIKSRLNSQSTSQIKRPHLP